MAVRAASSLGIVVVVAAGNYGLTARRQGSPRRDWLARQRAHRHHGRFGESRTTPLRAATKRSTSSARAARRAAAAIDKLGVRHYDNLLKPDLVAPGNKIVGALAGRGKHAQRPRCEKRRSLEIGGYNAGSNGRLMRLERHVDRRTGGRGRRRRHAAGQSRADARARQGDPAVHGAAAARRCRSSSKGTGLLNVDGAVRVAQSLRTDIAAGGLKPGDSLLAAGKRLPSAPSSINGETVAWSGIITAGGAHVVGGSALLEKYQAIYDQNLMWTGRLVTRMSPVYWSGSTDLPRAFVQRYAGKTIGAVAGREGARCGRGPAMQIERSADTVTALRHGRWPVTALAEGSGRQGGLAEGRCSPKAWSWPKAWSSPRAWS